MHTRFNVAPTRRAASGLLAIAVLLTALATAVAQASTETPGETLPASTTAAGEFSDEGVGAELSISDDGRHVAFAGLATNLSPEAPAGSYQVYVKDLDSASVDLVSRASDEAEEPGEPANAPNLEDPLISGDGRYVIFTSWADNLVDHEFEEAEPGHVYRRDLLTGVTEIVDRVDGPEGEIVDREGWGRSISDDGRYVLFTAETEDLDDPEGEYEWGESTLYLRDMVEGTTAVVSRASDEGEEPGAPAEEGSEEGVLSGDGRYVAFISYSTDLDPDANGYNQVYLRDLESGETAMVSRSEEGEAGEGESFEPVFVGDEGCRVGFTSEAPNLVTDAAPAYGAYLGDVCGETSSMELVSRDAEGDPFDVGIFSSGTANRDQVLFTTEAEFPLLGHLYLQDLDGGDLSIVDRASGVAGEVADASAQRGAAADNGCRIAFTSGATNLSEPGAPGGTVQAYVRQLAACDPPPEGEEPPTQEGGSSPAPIAAPGPARTWSSLKRLNRRRLVLAFSGAGQVRIRIQKRVGKPPRRGWRLVRKTVVRKGAAGRYRVGMPKLGPGRYRLTFRFVGTGTSRQVVKRIAVRR